jgi:hypothetical protein
MNPRPSHFSDSYKVARDRFVRAAEARGARLEGRPITSRGSRDEELALDTAYLGPDQPHRLLVVSSGIHGVEGFAGSAIQHQLLSEQWDGLELPGDTGLLLVHAVNPYGFAELRRVNEHNVDLNRNFLRHPDEHTANPGYEELFDAINPETLDEETDRRGREVLLAWAGERGFPALQAALSVGQYRHPQGVQFGGGEAEASNRLLRKIARDETRGARKIAWLDIHTGLGPSGELELISEAEPDDPGFLRGRGWYGEAAKSTATGESVSAKLQGVMERGVAESLDSECDLTIFGAEFGTHDPTRVFWAMRADNWLHHRGEVDSERGRAVKKELLEVFRPDSRAWEERVLRGGAEVIQRACGGLASS